MRKYQLIEQLNKLRERRRRKKVRIKQIRCVDESNNVKPTSLHHAVVMDAAVAAAVVVGH